MLKQSVAGAVSPYGSATAAFSPSAQVPSWISRLMRAAADRSEKRRRRREVAGNAAALSRLADHTLYDIGIHRSQITSLTRCMSDHPGADCRRAGV